MAVSTTRLVEVDRLVFADNVRTPACMQLAKMVESIKRHGYWPDRPLLVSQKGDGTEATYLVLRGNRRGSALLWLREHEPDNYASLIKEGKIPALVLRGLTREEEVDWRIDHTPDADRVPLDEWSTFLAIKQLVSIGIDTQEGIARKLGLVKSKGKDAGKPNRQYVQPRVNLARLPGYVQEEFAKLLTIDKSATNVRIADIATLYKVYSEEFLEYPEGNGPAFHSAWEKAMAPKDSKAKAGPDGIETEPQAKELSPAEGVRRAQAAQSKGLRMALLSATRQSPKDMSEIDAHILAGEVACELLSLLKRFMGEEAWTALLAEARTWEKNLKEGTDIPVQPEEFTVSA